MATNRELWGCCSNETDTEVEENSIKCSKCEKLYHLVCICLKDIPRNTSTWKCPSCLSSNPKVYRKDSTPIRNISMNRGPKRQATGSPSPPPDSNNTHDLQCTIKEVIQKEFGSMLEKFNNTIISTINQELEPIKRKMQGILDSMVFINKAFEDIKKEHESSKQLTMKIEAENKDLKSTVNSLNERLNNLEQQSRSNNLEFQCVPENKNENVYNVIMQAARVVNCEICEEDISHCTRIAKTNTSSSRPRSIIVQLTSPRKRDHLLAAIVKYNHTNPREKLNSCHLGYTGPKSPIYVAEHLSPSNRALHAASRVRAREKNYKYVWVRNGRIFVRKSDGTEVIQIRNKDSLAKIA